MDQAFVFILRFILMGGGGYLIGRNRKIGGGWSFAIGAILGLVGWIIILCSKKNNKPEFDDMSSTGGGQE